MGLLGTGCHRQLSDAVSKAAAFTVSPLHLSLPDLKHPICQSEQEDTDCVLIILRVAFPGTLSKCQHARMVEAQTFYTPCGTPPDSLDSAPVTELGSPFLYCAVSHHDDLINSAVS